MKIANTVVSGAVAVLLCAVLAASASAVTASYSVGGWGPQQFAAPTAPPADAPWGPNGYPGDAVEVQAYTGTLDLTPGVYVQKINTLLWSIDYTYGGTATDPNAWSDVLFALSAPRTISIAAANGTIAQAGSLNCTWENDYLSFAVGTPMDFAVTVAGSTYAVHVTPLAVDPFGGQFGSPNTRPANSPLAITCAFPCPQPAQDMMAQFIVDAPVPARMSSWGRLKSIYR
jgi:hypothetical protein